MKKILAIGCAMVLALFVTYSFAEMDSDMMEGQKSGMEHGQMMQHKGMMEHGQMMGDMMGMTSKMSDMMGKMSGMMKDIPADKMKQMSGLMKEMSGQMMEMSKVMHRGKASEKEMKKLHDGMTKMEKRFSGMEMTK